MNFVGVGETKMARYLVSQGAEVRGKDINIIQKTLKNKINGEDVDLEIVDYLVLRGANIDPDFQHEYSPLQLALTTPNANRDFIEYLLKLGSDPNRDRGGSWVGDYTLDVHRPIYIAAMNNPNLISLLIEYGAKGSDRVYRDIKARTDQLRHASGSDSTFSYYFKYHPSPKSKAEIVSNLEKLLLELQAGDKGVSIAKYNEIQESFDKNKSVIKTKIRADNDLSTFISEIANTQAYCATFSKVSSEVSDFSCDTMTDGRWRELVQSEACDRAQRQMIQYADEDEHLACPDGLYQARQQFINLWGERKKKAAEAVFEEYLKNNEVSEWTIKKDFPYFNTDIQGMRNAAKRAMELGHEESFRSTWDNFARDLRKPTTAEYDAVNRVYQQNMRSINRLARKLQSYKDNTYALDNSRSGSNRTAKTGQTLNKSNIEYCPLTASTNKEFDLRHENGSERSIAVGDCTHMLGTQVHSQCSNGNFKSGDFSGGYQNHVSVIEVGRNDEIVTYKCSFNVSYQCPCDDVK